MNIRVVLRVLGFILVSVGAAILPSVALSAFHHAGDLIPLLISALIPLGLGFSLLMGTRGRAVELGIKDGFAIVTFAWLGAAVFGALPYLLSGYCPSPAAAFFESMSGFTTTGSTIFTDIEALPKGILLWRSTTQWLGGMGMVVLSVAVLPILGIGGMQLYRAEAPGPTTDRLAPRIESAAKTLWGVYVLITLAEIALLMAGGMNLFEAVCHTFTTVSTGGFSTRNASIGAYHSVYLETVILVFMFLCGMNFSLHLWVLERRLPRYWANEEFRLYAIITLVATALVTLSAVFVGGESLLGGIRYSAFQVVSILTTTGYGTADYLLWGFGAQLVLFLSMFLGGCAASTAGGMKIMRVSVLAKHANMMAKKEIHPRAIYKIRFSGLVVPDDVMMRILGFFLLFMAIFFVSSCILGAMGLDIETSMGATISCLSNVGPGLGEVGPASNYAHLPAAAQVLLAGLMMLGRLELYTVLVLLTPTYWRRT